MDQPSLTQPPEGGHREPPKCYNCGTLGHFMVACPDPARKIPAGLAAARAAEATQAGRSPPEFGDNNQAGYGAYRPSKRQKTGPTVTRFPPPAMGPVVTHFGRPPAQALQYGPAPGPSYYGAPQAQQYYHQQQPMQHQPFPQHNPQQQGMPYYPYGSQPQPQPQGYFQPPMPTGSHVYGQGASNMAHPYAQPAPQVPPHQYDTRPPFQQNPMGAQSSPNHAPFQGPTPFQGQPMQHHPAYQGSSPIQTQYGPMNGPGAQGQQQFWGPGPPGPPYPAPTYHHGQGQFQRPYKTHNQKPAYQQPPYQGPQFAPNYSQAPVTPSSGPVSYQQGYQQGYQHNTRPQQHPQISQISISSGSPNIKAESNAAVDEPRDALAADPQPAPSDKLQITAADKPEILENSLEHEEFLWELEKIFILEAHKCADPIGRPLPNIYEEEPILPPAYNATSVISKYVRPNNLEVFKRDIRMSLHWPSLKADPAFYDIDPDSPLIPLEDIEAWLQQRYNNQNLPESAVQDCDQSPVSGNRAWSEEQVYDANQQIMDEAFAEPDEIQTRPASRQSSRDVMMGDELKPDGSRTPVVNRSDSPGFEKSGTPSFGADDDAWAPQPGEGEIVTSPAADSTEALLASLGVTGTPKPIIQKAQGYHSGPTHMSDPVPDSYGRGICRQDSGYVSARGSYSNGSSNAVDHSTLHGDYRHSYNGNNPPPPPPPLHMRRQVDGPYDSPSSDGSGRINGGHAVTTQDSLISGVNQASSPLTPNSAEATGTDGPTLYDNKSLKRPDPQRQVDDITPKLKRRQPKVADAYSRRW